MLVLEGFRVTSRIGNLDYKLTKEHENMRTTATTTVVSTTTTLIPTLFQALVPLVIQLHLQVPALKVMTHSCAANRFLTIYVIFNPKNELNIKVSRN